MTIPNGVLTSRFGSVWVFPEGPNHPGQYIGCVDADDIAEPQGDVTLIRCFDVWGKWKVVGEKMSAPDPVTTTLTQLTYKTRTWLERNRGEYGLILLQRDGGRADSFTNWVRALILQNVHNTSKTYGGVMKRETEDETTRAFAISATPPVIECVDVTGRRLATTELKNFADIAMLTTDTGILPYKYGVAVTKADVAIKAEVWLTDDGGQSWNAAATLPFAVNEDLRSCAILDMGGGIRRIIVGLLAPAGAQGKIAYTDDDGATWSVVNIGGATAGHGSFSSGTIFALDEHHIWMASAEGYIYFSSDAAQTWVVLEAGAITTDEYLKIDLTDDGLYGYAVSKSGVVARTVDGVNWLACTGVVSGTPDLWCVNVRSEDFAWVGDDNGDLWFTEDGGESWTKRTGWVGSGTGKVIAIHFADPYVGFMIGGLYAGTIYETIDGGLTWQVLPQDTTSGLANFAVGDENYLVYVGAVYTGFGFVGVLSE